jgi:O-antigen/teichoic acid export membrane protein
MNIQSGIRRYNMIIGKFEKEVYMELAILGAICFGLVIGWVTYRTLRRKQDATGLSDISAVIAAVGGAGVTALFKDPQLFGGYCIGLAIGFFAYFILALILYGKDTVGDFMGR